MANADLYNGFSQEKQTDYEAWLTERYGQPMRASVERAKTSHAGRDPAEQAARRSELREVEEALAGALRKGVDPASDPVERLIVRHRAWVAAMWGRPCPARAYAGLADLYLAHPDFVARYERIETGFAHYLTSAMKLHAARQGHRARLYP